MRYDEAHRSILEVWLIAGVALLLCAYFLASGQALHLRAAQAMTIEAVESAPEEGFRLEVVSVSGSASRQKKVFIYHTHTYEAYEMDAENRYTATETWRTADPRYNVIRVGEELADHLRRAGIRVTHDTTAYEPPKLSTAYSRSLKGLENAAAEGYDLYLDLHRDSYSQGNGPNTVLLDGVETARLLILVGQGTGSGLDDKPDWETNQTVGLFLSDAMNQRAQGLCRGVALKSGRYNQQAAAPCLLIEVGNNKNTLPEALNAMEPLARAICQYFDGLD